MTYIDTQQAAEELGVTRRRVQALINSGHLPATKLGRDWLIDPADLDRVRERRVGRPRKVGSKTDPNTSKGKGK